MAHAKAKGIPADLDAFNRRMSPRSARPIATRRSCSTGGLRLAGGLAFLEPVEASGILYAFHFYEPWEYTTFRVNRGRFAYPGPDARGPVGYLPLERATRCARWSRRSSAGRAAHAVPPSRIVAAEFGVDRRVDGALSLPLRPRRRARRERLAPGFLRLPGRRRLDRARLRAGLRPRGPAHLGRGGAWRVPGAVQAPPRQPSPGGRSGLDEAAAAVPSLMPKTPKDAPPADFASLGLSDPLVAAVDRPRVRGADAHPARGDPAAARGARPPRAGRRPAPARPRRSRCRCCSASREEAGPRGRTTAWSSCRRASWRCRWPRRSTSTGRGSASGSCRSTAARRWTSRSAR